MLLLQGPMLIDETIPLDGFVSEDGAEVVEVPSEWWVAPSVLMEDDIEDEDADDDDFEWDDDDDDAEDGEEELIEGDLDEVGADDDDLFDDDDDDEL
ncbi:MAG: hypothetical protein JNK58_09065 [Phycisphaerae bacterium]|nr:hypothetical protein [Phycisphaerae bacterium]